MDEKQKNEVFRNLAENKMKEDESKREQIKQVVKDSVDNNEEFESEKLKHQERLQKSNNINDFLNE